MPKSHLYAGRSPDHATSHLYAPGGLGVLGVLVPTTGEGGRTGLLANDVALNGWQNVEVRCHVVSSNFPQLFIYPDSSYIAGGLADTLYQATLRVYADGQDQGTALFELLVGPLTLAGAATLQPMAAAGTLGQVAAASMSGGATLAAVSAAGNLRSVIVGDFVAARVRTLQVLPGDVRVFPGSEISLVNRHRPTVRLDREAVIDLGFDFSAYLAGNGFNLDRFEFKVAGGLVLVEEAQSSIECAAVVMRLAPYEWGALTARAISAGSPSLADERTIFVRFVEK